MPEEPDEEPVEDYPVHLFLSREGYFKKITPCLLYTSGNKKRTGTTIRWLPDLDVFTDIDIPVDYYRDVMRRQAVGLSLIHIG